MGQQGQSDKFDKEDEKMEAKVKKTFALPLKKTKPVEKWENKIKSIGIYSNQTTVILLEHCKWRKSHHSAAFDKIYVNLFLLIKARII